MKKILKSIFIFTLLLSFGLLNEEPKNLQVLDFESVKEIKKYMKTITKNLGVKCKYCHDLNDKSKDTDHKKIAREMMRMQMDLNKSFFSHLGDTLHVHGEMPQISCWTCHRGSNQPELVKPKTPPK